MNDRLKFRAWDKNKNEMIYPDDDGCFEINDFREFRNYYHLEEIFEKDFLIIDQSTGLKDKNGKLIFEGDIVRSLYANVVKNVHIDVIVFKNGGFMAEGKIGDSGKCWSYLPEPECTRFSFDKSTYMKECEVIGNIHQNSELLEAK